ncbi:MAG: hypothetical protein R2705_05925 [Ilumatobacteraceae bacterium]
MATFRDLLNAAKAEITEVDPAEAEARIAAGGNLVVLDVREPDEYDQGALPGGAHIPRIPEAQVMARSSTDVPVVVLRRASARRSPPAVPGTRLPDVVSMAGAWVGRRTRPAWKLPVTLDAGQRNRYMRHLPPPRGRGRRAGLLLDAKVLMLGAGGLGSPASCTSRRPASARSASSTWTRSTSPTSSARSRTTWTGSVTAQSTGQEDRQ